MAVQNAGECRGSGALSVHRGSPASMGVLDQEGELVTGEGDRYSEDRGRGVDGGRDFGGRGRGGGPPPPRPLGRRLSVERYPDHMCVFVLFCFHVLMFACM